MAKRLTDKEKKQIIAYYIECQNLRETARKFNVQASTVKRIIEKDDETQKEIKQKATQKKQENTKNILQELDKTKEKRINLLNKMIDKMEEKVDNVDMFTNVKDLATAYGIIVDKDMKFAELSKDKEENEKRIIKIPASDMSSAFIDLNRDIDNRGHLEYWLDGGRASLKSSFCGEKIPEIIENNPNMCALCIRRVSNTLKDSVYAQIQWGIDKLNETYPGLIDDYTFKTSPMEITKKSTGQKIYFRGTDDPGKIKSIKPPKGMYIGIIWYEEFDQIQGMNAVRKINQSVIRGGNDFIEFYTFNTPASRQHFVNKEKRIPKPNRLSHHSDYRTSPKEWIGQAFIDEAEYTKETAPIIYENEYLGLETGDGGNVFENLELREITDEEISHFDRLYKGIDWGWYPDPFAYNNMHFDMARRTLYIFDELRCNKTSNENTWKKLKEKGVTSSDLITADSAENKSIGDYKTYGAFIRGAEKGPDSVEYSMKWLASLNKIIIDPTRCPGTAIEFSEYELERDKDGNIITGYPDKNNHNIDAVRYALETIWKKRGQ